MFELFIQSGHMFNIEHTRYYHKLAEFNLNDPSVPSYICPRILYDWFKSNGKLEDYDSVLATMVKLIYFKRNLLLKISSKT